MPTPPQPEALLGLFPPRSVVDGEGTLTVGGYRFDEVAEHLGGEPRGALHL